MKFKNKFGYGDVVKRFNDYVSNNNMYSTHFADSNLITIGLIQDCIDDMRQYNLEQYEKQEVNRKKLNLMRIK